MEKNILDLKKLNAAYIAALEYDRCPDSDKADDVAETFHTGVSREELVEALDENGGRRPDEIANSISDAIINL